MVRIIVMEVSYPVEVDSITLHDRASTVRTWEMYHDLSVFNVSNVAVHVEPVRATEWAAMSPWLAKLDECLEASVSKDMMTTIGVNA
jgi:hypothetical protein